MLYGIFYGYSIAECMYDVSTGNVALADIKVRQQRRFGYDSEGRLLLRTRSNPLGEIMPDYKFWQFKYNGGSQTDSAYGKGLAEQLYWPVTFKKSATKAWINLLDKYGAPTALGKFPPTATTEDKSKLLSTLAMIASSSGVIVPETIDISLLEPARGGNAGHLEFIE
jgi:phage gp29-like protein